MKYLASPPIDPLAEKFCSTCAAGLDHYKMGLHTMEKLTYQVFHVLFFNRKNFAKIGL